MKKNTNLFFYRSFSLIELMIVIVIIAILTGFAALEVRKEIKYSQEQVLKTNLKKLREQIDNFFADHGYYPPNLDDLTKGKYPYFAKLPEDPTTKLVDWQVRPPKLNIALNPADTFNSSNYPHASAGSSYKTSEDSIKNKFLSREAANPSSDWGERYYDTVKKLTNFDKLYGQVLDSEIYTDGTFTQFINDLKSKTDFEDVDTDNTNPLSEEAYVLVYEDAANLIKASPAQAIDGDLKTYWISDEGVSETWFKVELAEDDKTGEFPKVESMTISFKKPSSLDTTYLITEIKLLLGGAEEYILSPSQDPLEAKRINNYTLSINNPFQEDEDRVEYIQIKIRAEGGADPRPAISEFMVYRLPDDKPLPGDTVFSDYRWDVWRNYSPPGGVYNIRSNNPSYYDW
jgi:prepilin-type N-terminal cleavage/methylation domain-containing protein